MVGGLKDAPIRRLEDYVEKSGRAENVAELGSYYLSAIRSEGYENCILTTLKGQGVGKIAWYEFPDGYADAYIDKRWERVDPVLARTPRALRPFAWSDVTDRFTLSPAQRRFMDECRDLKVHSGIVFPFHGPNGRLDVMSISRRTSETADPHARALLHAVSLQTVTRYHELCQESLFAGREPPRLTPRELEILRWCKDGKSGEDIREILSISRQTVDFHLANIFKKLGASNKTSAVVMALFYGLIDL
jgi:LuxR family transcriptional regulator, quorum-sensing system regulator SolR